MKTSDERSSKASSIERVVRQFRRFVASGFRRTLFTRAIYEHLHLHCGFIAHYDIDGFYAARFADPDGRIATLRQLTEPSPWRFHDAENGDLNYRIYENVRDNADRLIADAVEYKKASLKAEVAALNDELEMLGA